MKIIFYRQFYHSQTVKLMNQGFSLFEWILRTDYKPYFVQVWSVIDGIGYDQMSDVYGVEAAEE